MGRVASEGLGKVVARHRAAAAATRAALVPLGLELWARQPAEAASVATLVRAPAQGAAALVQAALSAWSDGVPPVTVAPGSLAPQAVRVNHTGRRAALAPVWASVGALAGGLQRLGYAVDLGAALTAAGQAWEEALA